MKKTTICCSAFLLSIWAWAFWPISGSRVVSAAEPTPVIVELFTSEGCSSCPPADRLLAELQEKQPVEGAQIIALSQHVDYWNRLGWKDPFSDSKFSLRQRHYSQMMGTSNIYTPQMVVDGHIEFVGSDRGAALDAISQASQARKGSLSLDWSEDPSGSLQVRIGVKQLPASSRGRAEVLLALCEDGLSSQVSRGENQGRHLSHVAVVRRLERVSKVDLPLAKEWQDRAALELDPDWDKDHLSLVAFVQDRSGKITAAASVRISRKDAKTQSPEEN